MTQPKRESSIQYGVVEYARGLGMIARKLDFGEGWPDYLILFAGEALFIEFKRPGEKPTSLQRGTHLILENQGFVVAVVDNESVGKQLIRNFYELARGSVGLAPLRGNYNPDERS